MFFRDQSSSSKSEEILPFEMGYLPEAYVKKAEVELHETPDKRTHCLRLMREAAKKDKYMKNMEFDDDFLLQYLRARKYNVSRAFSSLKSLVYLRKKNTDMFQDFRFEVTVRTIKDKIVTVLPWRCPEGCTILLVQLDNWNPREFPVEEIKRMVVIMLLQCLRDPMTQVNGMKVIFDVRSNPLWHLRHCTPQNLYLLYHGTQDCAPMRYKEVHIVNLSLTFKTAWLFIKPFLSEKLKKRILLHPSEHKLLDYFPRDVLPVQYGGDLEDYDMTDWLRKVMTPEKLATIGGAPLPSKNSQRPQDRPIV